MPCRKQANPCSTENFWSDDCQEMLLLASVATKKAVRKNLMPMLLLASVEKTPTAKKPARIYEVEMLCKSRPSRIHPGKLEYLTQWRGYKRRSWNQAADFLGIDLQIMMQNCK